MERIRSGPAELEVRHLGGEGPVLVLVHGLGATQRSWDRLTPHLHRNLTIVTFDWRGHGRSSPGGPYDIHSLVADLEAVIEAQGGGPPFLMGHSLGALLAVEYAASRPCAGVIAVEGGLPADRPRMAWDEFEAREARPANRLMGGLLRALGLGSRLSIAELRNLTEDAEAYERRLEDTYRRMQCRLLIVLGSRTDPVPQGNALRGAMRSAAQQLQRFRPEVEVAWLDAGHLIPMQRPRELAELTLAFVSGELTPR